MLYCGKCYIGDFVDNFHIISPITDPSTNERFVTCIHPTYDLGDKAVISLPQTQEEEDELIDEDNLVDDFGKGDVNSCGIDNPANDVPGKKRACKNCSCGECSAYTDYSNIFSVLTRVL